MKYACLALLAIPMWGSTILTCQCTGPNATAVIVNGYLEAIAGAGFQSAVTNEQNSVQASLSWTDTLTIFGGTGTATVSFIEPGGYLAQGAGWLDWTYPSPTQITFGQPFTVSGTFYANAFCCSFTLGQSDYFNPLLLSVRINVPGEFTGTNLDPQLKFLYFDDPVSTAAVPEPGTGWLLMAALLLYAAYRQRELGSNHR